MNDIMRILTLKLLENYFRNEESDLLRRFEKIVIEKNISESYIKRFLPICKNIEVLQGHDNPINEWKILVKKILINIFPAIYHDEDATFNCSLEDGIRELIGKITELEINKEFIDTFGSACGDIHEAFRAYGGKKGAKELGQFFTPRKLINLCMDGLKLKDDISEYKNPEIYDPCMGTGGFLTRLYKLSDNIKPENIYGCETELDTIKFAHSSLLLTTNNNKAMILKIIITGTKETNSIIKDVIKLNSTTPSTTKGYCFLFLGSGTT